LPEIFLARPDWGGVAFVCRIRSLPNAEALLISLGIWARTVMPHNLICTPRCVQTRATDRSPEGVGQAIKFNTLGTVLALSLAFLSSGDPDFGGSRLVVHGIKVDSCRRRIPAQSRCWAGRRPRLCGRVLASGQSSTITGTLAGRSLWEGFLRFVFSPGCAV